ncbi:MAG TPA: hypothetical protein VMB52_05750 [Verrucomicrobiae bacterium]|nr:hypothetical protein [Verrucomicrobiae bacterium]
MEAVRGFYLRSWRGLVLGLSLALIAYLLYFHRLSSLLPGFSASELTTYTAVGNWHSIAKNPVNAPYKLLVWLFAIVLRRGILASRAISAIIGVAIALLFYVVARAWCHYRVAFISTIMFATSAGLLRFARLGTGDVTQMSVLALLVVVLWYRQQKEWRLLIGYLLVALFVVLCYVPGMFWFEALGFIPLSTTIRGQLRRTKTIHLAGLLVMFLVLLAPLIIASVGNPRVLLQLSGLPQTVSTISHVGHDFLTLVLGILVHSSGSPALWVGHAPLLDAVEVIIAILGAFYAFREATGRTTFLFGWLTIGIVLASLGGSVTFACIVPALYLFIAIGFDHLLGSWLTVFPRNPIARVTGIGIVCLMAIFSILYQVRTYYVAWPHTPGTREVYSHPAP